MGYIKEPKNVDFVVAPTVLSEANKRAISDAIAFYRKTGQQPGNADVQIANSRKNTSQAKTINKKSTITKNNPPQQAKV